MGGGGMKHIRGKAITEGDGEGGFGVAVVAVVAGSILQPQSLLLSSHWPGGKDDRGLILQPVMSL
jgi:hypothetical protein